MALEALRQMSPDVGRQYLGCRGDAVRPTVLRAWACQNCATSSLAREDDVAIWRATEERARTREAFLRSVRSTLKRLAIDVSRLKGRWLVLADEGSVALPQPLPPPDVLVLAIDAGEPAE